MFREVATTDDILPGGMKAYEVNGVELVLCNNGGHYYAFQRRCGHMNAPLDMGTVNGYIITCPLHSIQFDAANGRTLSGIVPSSPGEGPLSRTLVGQFTWIEKLIEHIKVHDLKTYPVKVEGGKISVDL
ncbi:MAG TPA: Rieske 2Fe-2S domain-containing protein [Methanocella sp.]|nr:Rieske 2Fe-2S domain-containing protein [Methanocella sp.]